MRKKSPWICIPAFLVAAISILVLGSRIIVTVPAQQRGADPTTAADGSVRRAIFQQWKELGPGAGAALAGYNSCFGGDNNISKHRSARIRYFLGVCC